MIEKSKTRESIQNAVIKLMETTDIPEIRVKSILELADVSRSTFYRYYNSVNDVVDELEMQIMEELRNIDRYLMSSDFSGVYYDTPNPVALEIFKYLESKRQFFIVIYGPHGDPRFSYKMTKLVQETYGLKVSRDNPQVNCSDLYVKFALCGHRGLIEYWITQRSDITAESMAIITSKLMFGIFRK